MSRRRASFAVVSLVYFVPIVLFCAVYAALSFSAHYNYWLLTWAVPVRMAVFNGAMAAAPYSGTSSQWS